MSTGRKQQAVIIKRIAITKKVIAVSKTHLDLALPKGKRIDRDDETDARPAVDNYPQHLNL